MSVAEHAPGCSGTLLHRVLPVLDAHPLPKDRVIVVGHVAGGVDVLDVRSAVLVHEDPVAGLHAAASDEVHDRFDSHPDNGEITIDAPTAFGDHPFDAPVALEAVTTSSKKVSTPCS